MRMSGNSSRKWLLFGISALSLGWAFDARAQIISMPGTTTGQAINDQSAKKTKVTSKLDSTGETISVVGTHLGAKETAEIQPVTVITSEQIQQSSSMTTGDIFAHIPSMGFSGSTFSNAGGSCLNIRSLGTARTLVLVDGHRMVNGNGAVDCPDVNAIVPAMIDRIEILKDGSSTTYGSDAIAGVVNIILKKNFTGTTFTANGGVSEYGDDQTAALTMAHGFNFDHDRGNFTIAGSYNYQAPMAADQRKWAMQEAKVNNPPGQAQYFGSQYGPRPVYAAVNGGRPLAASSDGVARSVISNGDGTYSPYSWNDNYDYSQDNQIISEQQVGTLAVTGHYDVNPHLQLYMTANYSHTQTQSVGTPMYIATPVTTLTGNSGAMVVPAGEPGNPFGEDVALYDRMFDLGRRYDYDSINYYQFTGGAKGDLPSTHGWTYDFFFSYGKTATSYSESEDVNWRNMENALGFHQTGGAGSTTGYYDPNLCSSIAGCAPWNPFSGTMSQAARNYIGFTDVEPSGQEMRDVQFTVANKHLAKLPYGPLGIALGVEHRSLDGYFHSSWEDAAGLNSNLVRGNTGGGYNVTEVFGELSIPLLKDLPMAKALSAEVSGRFSNYDTFGQTYNWHAGLIYAPTRDISVRANIATGFRAPTIQDLYRAKVVSLTGTRDPCAYVSTYPAGVQSTIIANCRAQGVNPSSFKQTNGSLKYETGGNAELQPELSRTYTIGTIVTPRFLPGFTATIDYFHTHITEAIGYPSLSTELNGCYESSNLSSSYCSILHGRDIDGQLYPVSRLHENTGAFIEDGIDINASYYQPIDFVNALRFGADIQDVTSYKQQSQDGQALISYLGTDAGPPKWVANGTATFSHGRWDFTYMLRFIDGFNYYPSSSYGPGVSEWWKTNQAFYHDVMVTYHGDRYSITAGVKNIGGRDPNFYANGSYNTSPDMYDYAGRYMYLKAQVHF
ncbi:TonB-dependent receptor [Gluconacetobacter aggeris]|uniref:TonB-dependent receptor n=1 Tax=Gluconacetobacter aggeris TaxID=1286186 RepID=A0A7W4IQY1_9PROT|nr:TonB-dependent receptor [Gluconacetobacter aggeris]MBB2167440.1 TonB-dependent receptor [Gluconacetobacter aggeris]